MEGARWDVYPIFLMKHLFAALVASRDIYSTLVRYTQMGGVLRCLAFVAVLDSTIFRQCGGTTVEEFEMISGRFTLVTPHVRVQRVKARFGGRF